MFKNAIAGSTAKAGANVHRAWKTESGTSASAATRTHAAVHARTVYKNRAFGLRLSRKKLVALPRPPKIDETSAASIPGRLYKPRPLGPSARAVKIASPAESATLASRTAKVKRPSYITRCVRSNCTVKDHFDERFQKQGSIDHDRGAFHVKEIVREHFAHVFGAEIAFELQLRPARDSRRDDVPLYVGRQFTCETLRELRHLGPRTDDRHFAAQHVEELRQFVDARAP